VREIQVSQIAETVAHLCQEATHFLPEDVVQGLRKARDSEESPLAKQVLVEILENVDIAARETLPLCQDTGTTVVMVELGQEVHIEGGYLYDAINQGVGKGYTEGYLRASIVDKPFSARVNTKNNTPAVIHVDLVPGDQLKIKVVPKGGGCENMTRFTILLPGEGKKGITDFVLRTVEESGGNPCPPVIVGVGIGGSAEYAMLLAKRAITRKVGELLGRADAPVLARLSRQQLQARSGVQLCALQGLAAWQHPHLSLLPRKNLRGASAPQHNLDLLCGMDAGEQPARIVKEHCNVLCRTLSALAPSKRLRLPLDGLSQMQAHNPPARVELDLALLRTRLPVVSRSIVV